MRDLVRDWHDGRSVVGQRRLGHQDLELAAIETLDDLGRALARRELVEELLDVGDFERALLQRVFADYILHRGLGRGIVRQGWGLTPVCPPIRSGPAR